MNKKIAVFYYVQLGCAALFSLLSLSFNLDVSLFAFPISIAVTGVAAYFIIFKMIRPCSAKLATPCYKISEYLPFVLLITFLMRRAGKNGVPYWYDVVTVLLWTVIFITSLIISWNMSQKRIKQTFKGWKNVPDFSRRPKGALRILYEAVDWIDAIIGAVFDVLLIQIFLFQLYMIPSESMVPTFLIKDQVVVSKINCGPKFPLTDVGVPDFGKYKRGDIVVLRNPHYSHDRKAEVKTVTSQLLYMLTFMKVNLNRDENGELKADPLVKRIAGEPGEQLVMQDGQLYARTKNSDEFKPVEKDNKYAAWNLNELKPSIKLKVETIPFTQAQYESMLELEEERRNMNLNVAEMQASEIASKFSRYCTAENDKAFSLDSRDFNEFNLFSKSENIAAELLTASNGSRWFSDFMLSWTAPENKNKIRDMYAEANFRLNVMVKLCFGNIVLRAAELNYAGTPYSEWKNDVFWNECWQRAELLNWYIQIILDERNMPVFPACDADGNPKYIPENCYFMMGDNRFNSLDLRHSYEQTLAPLTSDDALSVSYYSMMAPQYINKKYIIGKPVYRVLPVGRIGKIR